MSEKHQKATDARIETEPIRVLVVDDSELVRMMIGGFLTKAGHLVEAAVDGQTALRMLQQGSFDVAVTDLHMPVLDGFGLIEQSKALGIVTEFIILTGSSGGDVSAAVRALRLGAHDFLPKPPASPDEVVLAVERAAEKKRLRETNARLLAELEALSSTDALTGVGNRRAFDQALQEEEARVHRYGVPLSLVLMDLDHFKQVNDTHGHQAGDEVLRTFAARVREAIRESDRVYRYGGEEFVVLMPHTTGKQALEAARRIVATIAFNHITAGEIPLRITCSAGVAAIASVEDKAVDLIGDADAALYKAKSEGRNRARAKSPRASLSLAS